jgi:acyl-CoA thioesterase-1
MFGRPSVSTLRKFLPALAIAFACSLANAYGAPTILVFGDSLSAGHGLARGQGWADLLERRLRERGSAYTVVNASISGETTAGGRARIDGALERFSPAIVVLELGANDGLRGSSLSVMRQNLEYMVAQAKKHGARVVVVGMRLPPNYGPQYATEFFNSFREVAKKDRTAYVPFLFDGLKDDAETFQADRLHPTAQAQPVMLDTVWRMLAPLLHPGAR